MIINELRSPAAGLRLGTCGPLLVSCFNDWPNGAMLSALADAQLTLSKTHPRIVSLSIIPATPATPNVAMQMPAGERSAAVKQSAKMAEELRSITAANAVVILSRGLIAVMVRAFMAALGLVSKGELKTFRTLEEAEAWFLTVKDLPSMPSGLAVAVDAWLQQPG